MSDLSDWRAEKRRDKQADAEQKRSDAAAALDRQLKLEEARAEQDRKTRRDNEGRAKRERTEQQAKRRQQWDSARVWLKAEADTAFSVAMIVLSVIPAIASQVAALSGKTDPGSATALALMLELGAWSATVGASRAMRDGRPVLPYRVAMWLCALVAAAINVSHNGGFTDWFGLVMGAASIAGVAFWELRCVGRHGTSRRTKAERAEAKARKAHARSRRRHHRPIWDSASRILSGAPYGTLTRDEAWALAWADVHGDLQPGRTGAMELQRTANRKALSEALNPRPQVAFPSYGGDLEFVELPPLSVYRSSAETAADGPSGTTGNEQVTNQIPQPKTVSPKRVRKVTASAAVKGGKVGPGNPPVRRKGDTPRYSTAARVAAHLTAVQSSAS